MALFDNDKTRWAAVSGRDSRADGAFVYCVKTTNIYCRPTCKARLARRSNVTFHDTGQNAEEAGFRACKRCRPELSHYSPHVPIVEQACATIRSRLKMGLEPTLQELATEAGMSEFHFHRVFKGVVGVTPKGYSRSVCESTSEEVSSSTSKSSDGFTTPSETNNPPSTPLEGIDHIEFTIQPWSTFYVLIATANENICAIDTADSYPELVSSIQQRFPSSTLELSEWNKQMPVTDHSHSLFATVMEALENPSGKTIDVSPQAFTFGLVPESHTSLQTSLAVP